MNGQEFSELLASALNTLADTQGTDDEETAIADYYDIFRIGARHGFGIIDYQMPDDSIRELIQNGDKKRALDALSEMKKMINILEEEKSIFARSWKTTYDEICSEL